MPSYSRTDITDSIILLYFREENASFLLPYRYIMPFQIMTQFMILYSNATFTTDTWGRLVSTTLSHKTCINTSRQVLEKTLFAINAIFTQDNNLSKPKVEGSLQKTNATCSNV